jgi:hypothetical protein
MAEIKSFDLGSIPIKSEFVASENIMDLFSKHDLPISRMIGASKSTYRTRFPSNIVVFNANIITITSGKIWHGDLDVTKEIKSLTLIAQELGEPLFVLSEMDARFETENDPMPVFADRAIAMISSSGTALVRTKLE